MNINALLLANSAEVKDDLLHVTGGGWEGLTAPAWPAAHEIHAVVLLTPAQADLDKDLPAVVRVLTPTGAECGRTEATVRLPALRQQVHVVMPVFGEFEEAGEHRVSVTLGSTEASVAFQLSGPPAHVRVPQQ